MLVGIETKAVGELDHDNHVHEENDKNIQDHFSSLEIQMHSAFHQLVQSFRQPSLAQNSAVKNDGVCANNQFQYCNENAFLHSATLAQQMLFISPAPTIERLHDQPRPIQAIMPSHQKSHHSIDQADEGLSLLPIDTAAAKQLCTHASTLTNLGPDQTVAVETPVVIDAGQVFDGKGATFVPTKNIGDGSSYEFQQPVFIIENGATLKNVKFSGGDGVHFVGDGTMLNCTNTRVGEDAVTIDGPGNRAHDAFISGSSANGLPPRAHVDIINCTFDEAKDKVIQDNGIADVTLNGIHVNGATTVFRTLGGDRQLDSNVLIKNAILNDIRFAVFRTDAPDAHVTFEKVATDAPYEVIAVHPAEQSSGASRIAIKP